MNFEQLRTSLPECAKDIKLNLSSVLTEEGAPELNQKQIFGIALASAYATQNMQLVAALLAEAENILAPNEIEAAKAAAIIMAMNNVYYRFVHLASDKSFATMPAKLRMNIIGNPGINKADFELYCLAVSAINGCGMCIDAHAKELTKAGVSNQAIQSAVRIAATLNATALTARVGAVDNS